MGKRGRDYEVRQFYCITEKSLIKGYEIQIKWHYTQESPLRVLRLAISTSLTVNAKIEIQTPETVP